jgi:ABC-type phosphate transport system auxiliary subunit
VTSQEIVEEFQQLEQKLATLRARAEEDESTYSELEGQVHELNQQLVLTRREVADLERLLMEKRREFLKAEYDVAFQAREEAAARLAEAISQVLAELDLYAQAQQALAVLQGGPDARDAKAEPELVTQSWERLVNAVGQRINELFEDELIETASRSLRPSAIRELPEHLREAARERTRARRRSGFSA